MKWRRVLVAGVALAALGLGIVYGPPYIEKLVMKFSPPGGSAGRWLTALDSPDEEKRIEAVRKLGTMDDDADATVPVLARVMLDEKRSKGERIESAFALAKLSKHSPAARGVVPELTQAVGDKEAGVRMDAMIALMNLREAGRPAASALAAAMKNEENDTNVKTFLITIKEQAAVTLGFVTAGTAEGIDALTEALKTAKTSDQRKAALRGLGLVGPVAKVAVPQIRDYTNDPDTNVSRAAREALESIQKEEKKPAPGG